MNFQQIVDRIFFSIDLSLILKEAQRNQNEIILQSSTDLIKWENQTALTYDYHITDVLIRKFIWMNKNSTIKFSIKPSHYSMINREYIIYYPQPLTSIIKQSFANVVDAY